ncbi:MAG: response regulator transcription factor [Alphaproteobacteria bacterium]|nr:response regulator transcription factor [Alphaproteobacteria bacterium]
MEPNVAVLDQAVADTRSGRGLRILVVWAVRFTRESLAEILERDPLVAVVGQCASLSEAVALSSSLKADVILLDGRIPDGPATVRRALDIAPDLRIIACSVRETEEDIIAWAEVGVIGYIPRTAALADFVRLMIDIHNGEQMSSGRVVTGLLRRIAMAARRRPNRDAALLLPALTKREREAAELIRSGLSDKEIARQLNISLATTKSHVHNLLGKLNVQRRSQVAEWLREYERPPALAPAAAPASLNA